MAENTATPFFTEEENGETGNITLPISERDRSGLEARVLLRVPDLTDPVVPTANGRTMQSLLAVMSIKKHRPKLVLGTLGMTLCACLLIAMWWKEKEKFPSPSRLSSNPKEAVEEALRVEENNLRPPLSEDPAGNVARETARPKTNTAGGGRRTNRSTQPTPTSAVMPGVARFEGHIDALDHAIDESDLASRGEERKRDPRYSDERFGQKTKRDSKESFDEKPINKSKPFRETKKEEPALDSKRAGPPSASRPRYSPDADDRYRDRYRDRSQDPPVRRNKNRVHDDRYDRDRE